MKAGNHFEDFWGTNNIHTQKKKKKKISNFLWKVEANYTIKKSSNLKLMNNEWFYFYKFFGSTSAKQVAKALLAKIPAKEISDLDLLSATIS